MTDVTSSVPSEVLWACIDYLELLDITRVMGVSKRWQQLAIGHETYWKHLSISSSSSSATQWFLLRLSRSCLRLVRIDALLLDADPFNLYAILRAITAHLAYVQHLTCWVNYQHSSWLFNTLCYPAYNIELLTLRVNLNLKDLRIPSLPSALLMRTAPRLRKLAVQNIAIGNLARNTFPLLVHLEYGLLAKYELADVQRLLDAFDSIQELTLTGYPRIKDPFTVQPAPWHNLRALELHLGYPIPENVREVLCIPRIAHITCGRATGDDLHAVMAGIDGTLEMHIQPASTSEVAFFIHILETSTARVRSFPEWEEFYHSDEPFPCPLLSHVRISERITLVSIAAQYWSTVLPYMLPLPALSELRIVVSLRADYFFADESTQTLHCPKLKTLTLRSSEPVTRLDAAMLTGFMARSLTGAAFPLDLRLEGVFMPNPALLPPGIVRAIEDAGTVMPTYPVDQSGLLT
ncbi:hypothetical protein AURDEDRAFT_164575 [Auricularia subglabra TFB-10046 SS5]|nr:hypothetical protein AURDEDRAFT_164575 [Auricularia subglabra TFB-10046 SS5]